MQETYGSEGCTSDYFILSTGITDKDFDHLKISVELLAEHNIEVKFVCIDVANGYMFKLIEFCKRIRDMLPNRNAYCWKCCK